MKKFLTTTLALALVVIITFNLGSAIAGPIKDAVISKILSVKAKEFVSPEFIARVFKQKHFNFGDGSCDLNSAYYQCRDVAFTSLFTVAGESEGGRYLGLRTIAVAQFKGQLHSGNTLMETYGACRPTFVAVVSAEDSEFQANLLTTLRIAISEFEKVQKDTSRAAMVHSLAADPRYVDDQIANKERELEMMLGRNASALQIAEKVESESITPEVTASPAANLDTTRFALRRWNEGGKPLTDKYLAVLRLAERDIAGIVGK